MGGASGGVGGQATPADAMGGTSSGGAGGAAGAGASGGGSPEAGPSSDVGVDSGGTVDAPSSLPDGSGGVAVCWPDPRVIKICHQLENACENCPPGGAPPKNQTATICFALVKKAYAGMATDADCEKFAVDHKCTVDNVATTGNVCGSPNCNAPGCRDKARCLNRQQWGDSSMCRMFMDTCPCK